MRGETESKEVEEGMYLARMGIQVWKIMVYATRKQNDVQNKGAIPKRERPV